MNDRIRAAALLYASFDEKIEADQAGGKRILGTRYGHPAKPGGFEFEQGVPAKAFRIAGGKGVAGGGALEGTDVLPRFGRIYFPAKGNIAFREGGWGGTVSFWLNTNPDKLLKTSFCDPVQITHKGAHNGGLWIDFPDKTPRQMRLGVFPGLREGEKPLAESDANAAIVTQPAVGFQQGEWHHVAFTWDNFDTGRPDASARLYIDGKPVGSLEDRELAMRWDIDHVGIYVAVAYIGLLDEFAVFSRALSAEEIRLLHQTPALLQGLAN